MPSKITTLTDKDRAKFKGWAEKWIKQGLRTDEADWENFEKGVNECYLLSNLTPVKIIRVPSPIVGAYAAPISALVIANLNKKNRSSAVDSAVRSAVRSTVDSAIDSAVDSAKKIFWHYWMGGQFWPAWQSYVTFFVDNMGWTPEGDILRRIRAYELAQKSACYWWPNKDFVIVCNRPKHIHRNNQGQLHSEKEQAIEWRDGWGLYMLNGVRVNKEIVLTPASKLDPHLIAKETNAEVRREIVRKIGIERVCQKLGSKTLESRWGYDLITLDLGDGRNRPYLKMKNPSIGTYHLEGVPPEIKTVESALSWRNGIEKYEEPLILT